MVLWKWCSVLLSGNFFFVFWKHICVHFAYSFVGAKHSKQPTITGFIFHFAADRVFLLLVLLLLWYLVIEWNVRDRLVTFSLLDFVSENVFMRSLSPMLPSTSSTIRYWHHRSARIHSTDSLIATRPTGVTKKINFHTESDSAAYSFGLRYENVKGKRGTGETRTKK